MHILAGIHAPSQGDTAPLETWTDYLRRVTGDLTRREIAQAADINVSAVSRWITGASRPSPEKVIEFARGLNQSPIEALIAAGYLKQDDLGGAVELVQSLAVQSDDALVDELRARLHRSVDDAEPRRTPLAKLKQPGVRRGQQRLKRQDF
jgi:transcriptional regulator with XRE-family HTH domain